MRNYTRVVFSFLVLFTVIYTFNKVYNLQKEIIGIFDTNTNLAEEVIKSKTKIMEQHALEIEKKSLIEFTLTAMDMSPKAKKSMASKQILAEKIANTVIKYLPDRESREQYVSMIKIESNFENIARSPVGAVGIGQIMPGTFNGVIKQFDSTVKSEDISNEDINLAVGAYYYNILLTEQKNNPRLASIAYNGGGKTAEKFKKMVDINPESSNYALKTEHVKDTVRQTIAEEISK